MKSLIAVLFFASIHTLIHGTTTKIGPYCIAQKGFFPSKITVEDMEKKGLTPNITYKAWLSNAKVPCGKLVNGNWTIHRRIKTIGMHMKIEKYSDGQQLPPGKNGNEIRIENLCESKIPTQPFWDKFSGTVDDTCSLEPGEFTLTDWTLHDHMKLIPIDVMMIALYKVSLCWLEDNKHCVMENEITMDFMDAGLNEAQNKMAALGGANKAKANREKGKDKKKKKNEDAAPKVPDMPWNAGQQ